MTGEQAASVAVYADGVRYGIQGQREGFGKLPTRHIQDQSARLCRIAGIRRLQGQVQQDILTERPCLGRQVLAARRRRQYGKTYLARQTEGSLANGQSIAEVIDDNCNAGDRRIRERRMHEKADEDYQ